MFRSNTKSHKSVGEVRENTLLFTMTFEIMMFLNSIEKFEACLRVPGLVLKDCARSYNHRAQVCIQLSTMQVTAKTFF